MSKKKTIRVDSVLDQIKDLVVVVFSSSSYDSKYLGSSFPE